MLPEFKFLVVNSVNLNYKYYNFTINSLKVTG